MDQSNPQNHYKNVWIFLYMLRFIGWGYNATFCFVYMILWHEWSTISLIIIPYAYIRLKWILLPSCIETTSNRFIININAYKSENIVLWYYNWKKTKNNHLKSAINHVRSFFIIIWYIRITWKTVGKILANRKGNLKV